MTDQTPPPAGHNNPPSPMEEFIGGLADTHRPLTTRLDDLLIGCAKAPDEVTPDNAPKVTDFIAQIKGALKEAESQRKAAKAPHDEKSKAVQAFFARLTTPIEDAMKALEKRLGVFHMKQAEAERARQDAERKAAADAEAKLRKEAEDKAEEARKAAAAAESQQDRAAAARAIEDARNAEAAAAEAAKKASAKTEAHQTRGEYGASAHSRTTWKFEVIDPAAIPLGYLMPDEAAIRAAITKGAREIPGLRIYPETTVIVKK